MALPKAGTTCPRYGMAACFWLRRRDTFSRPGPRLAAGVAILADAVHDGQQASLTPRGAGLVLARVAAAEPDGASRIDGKFLLPVAIEK